jgi:PAS domain S-box-containing protein
MQQTFTKKILDFLLIRKVQESIGEEDLVSMQRFNLFRTFSFTSFLIGLAITYQILEVIQGINFLSISLVFLTLAIISNYYFLNFTKNFKLAYIVLIASVFFILHFVTYYSGGIRNSGMIYLGSFILASFMLLGKKAGKIISVLSVINLFFFYFYSVTFGHDVRNVLDADETGEMLNLDYLITYTTGTVLLYALSNNLESAKNVIIANILDSKISLQKKNDELEKLSIVASNTDNSVIIIDKFNKIEWVNEAFTQHTGYNFNEVLGKNPEDFMYGPLTNKETVENLKEKVKQGNSFSGEILKYHKMGHTFWHQLTITPIYDKEGTVTRYVRVGSEITERKLAEVRMAEYYKYLEKANKELDKFAYVVSHDLKAPLRAISNLTIWIEEDIGDKFTEDTKSHFKMLKGRVERMEGLINGILDYSRADRVKSPNVEISVGELISEIAEMVISDDKVQLNIKNAMPVIFTEKMKLQQVFSNLITNAIKHNDKEVPTIDIYCKEDGDNYIFEVVDNGPGIEQQFHDKIFVIFQTLQARDTFESTGVGLAIVKKIVDEVGGKIWVESQLNIETRFIFQWPKNNISSIKPFQFSMQNSNSKIENNISSVA